jgi:RNA polymerase sigma factor (TIGR02999 family)
MAKLTVILNAIERGDQGAVDQLLPEVYQELRALASQRLSQERPGQTLQATALVHEAYLRLIGTADHTWRSRGHFFAAAAEAMRRILVERARQRRRLKRGGAFQRVEIDGNEPVQEDSPEILLALDEALTKLAHEDPVKAELVKLRYFAGLTIPEAAKALNISKATADRYWSYARAWLFQEINKP